VRVDQADLRRAALPRAGLVDDDVVHHPPAECLRVRHARPAGGQAVQRLLIRVLAQALVGREQRRQPKENVTGLRDELNEKA
jgi:hypothetical protein